MNFSGLTQAIDLEPWWRFGAALLIGALIGLEREFKQQQSEVADFAGLRTFSLISLLGAIAGYLARDVGVWPAIAAFVGVMLLAIASHIASLFRRRKSERRPGTTTEVASFISFLLGWMVMADTRGGQVAVGLAVVIAVLLALKPMFSRIIEKMSKEDLYTILQFGILAAVILPLLPNQGYGPGGILNPFRIWLFLVFISGIGFIGYVLMKWIGPEKGVGITGILGGLASSTAATVGFAGQSRQEPRLSDMLALGILLASAVMFPRQIVLALVVFPPLVRLIAIPLGLMLVAALVAALWLWRRHRRKEEDETQGVQIENPLKLRTALTFAVIYAIVLIAANYAQQHLGSAGVYLISFIAGITDVNAITLTISDLARNATIPAQVAALGILISGITNTASKGVIAYSLGSPELRKHIVPAFGLIVVVGIAASLLLLL